MQFKPAWQCDINVSTHWGKAYFKSRCSLRTPFLDTIVAIPLDLQISSWLCVHTMSQANKMRSHDWKSQLVWEGEGGSGWSVNWMNLSSLQLTSNIMSCKYSTIILHQGLTGSMCSPDLRLQQYTAQRQCTSTTILHPLWNRASGFCMWLRATSVPLYAQLSKLSNHSV